MTRRKVIDVSLSQTSGEKSYKAKSLYIAATATWDIPKTTIPNDPQKLSEWESIGAGMWYWCLSSVHRNCRSGCSIDYRLHLSSQVSLDRAVPKILGIEPIYLIGFRNELWNIEPILKKEANHLHANLRMCPRNVKFLLRRSRLGQFREVEFGYFLVLEFSTDNYFSFVFVMFNFSEGKSIFYANPVSYRYAMTLLTPLIHIFLSDMFNLLLDICKKITCR
jgi:hypothetical protein